MPRWRALAVFMLAFSSVHATDPTVKMSQTEPTDDGQGNMFVERDKDASLSCYVENLQEDVYVRWIKEYADGRPPEEIAADTSIKDNTKFSIDKPTTQTWRLRIKNIQLSDEGIYMCVVKTTIQNQKETRRNIFVQIPPYFDPIRTSSDMQVQEGENVYLQCYAEGKPEPVIEWSRLGNQLLPIGKERHRESDLTILRVKPEDRGTYRCSVTNAIGSLLRQIRLDVLFKPIITIGEDKIYQAQGYLIELQCFVEANPFPSLPGMGYESSQLAWKKGSKTIGNSDGHYKLNTIRGAFNQLIYELIIEKVDAEDFGQYQCVVSNSRGTSTGRIMLIEAETPQKSVKLGRVVMSGVSGLALSLSTLFTCIFTILLHRFNN